MSPVFRSRGRVRIAVNTRDHPPPHVHAFGTDREARFKLNCPEGPVELWDYAGEWRLAELNALGVEIADRLEDCCREWTDVHG